MVIELGDFPIDGDESRSVNVDAGAECAVSDISDLFGCIDIEEFDERVLIRYLYSYPGNN